MSSDVVMISTPVGETNAIVRRAFPSVGPRFGVDYPLPDSWRKLRVLLDQAQDDIMSATRDVARGS